MMAVFFGSHCSLRCTHEALDVIQATLSYPRLHELERPGDPGQQVVEVVRQAPGKLTHGFHLL